MSSTSRRKRTFRQVLRGKGVYLTAEEARIIRRAVARARVDVTEPGADVVARFMRRCEELDQ